jgi:hypothetical protein
LTWLESMPEPNFLLAPAPAKSYGSLQLWLRNTAKYIQKITQFPSVKILIKFLIYEVPNIKKIANDKGSYVTKFRRQHSSSNQTVEKIWESLQC